MPALRGAGALLVLVALLAACTDDADAPNPTADAQGGEDGELTKLTVTPAGPSITSSGYFYLPEYLGFTEEEGLEVDVLTSFEGSTPLVALIEGQLDVIVGDPDVMGARILEDPDFPVTCVATITMWPFRVIVPADSDIQTAADLEGLTIGVPDQSDVGTLSHMLLSAGVDPETVDAVAVGGRAPSAVEMFAGRTDASMGSHVDQMAMEQEFGADSIRVIETIDPEGAPNGCLSVRTQMLEDEPEVVEGFMRALAKGSAVFFEDRELAVDLIGQAYDEAYDDRDGALDLVDATIEVNGPAYEARWEFSEEAWQEFSDSFVESGFISEPVDITGHLDFSMLDAAWDFDIDAVLEEARDQLE
jgi:NitT/TauT family transport system substrate-binding protein